MQNKVIIKVVTIVVKMADRDEERSDSDADFSERQGPRSRGGGLGGLQPLPPNNFEKLKFKQNHCPRTGGPHIMFVLNSNE